MDIGAKIKNLRTRQNLTQEELAQRSELTKGFISQVERNLTSPSVTSLMDILEALGTNLGDFFRESTVEKVVFKEEDYFETEDEDLGYQLSWIVPNAQKNEMEPTLWTLRGKGRTRQFPPHEGEEFGYVLKGSVCLHHGESTQVVSKGETFYLSPTEVHFLENPKSQEAVILWVSTPPTF